MRAVVCRGQGVCRIVGLFSSRRKKGVTGFCVDQWSSHGGGTANKDNTGSMGIQTCLPLGLTIENPSDAVDILGPKDCMR